MDPRTRALRDEAARQHGLFTWEQGVKSGFSNSSLSRQIARNGWEPVLPGVYSISVSGLTWRQRLIATVLWAGDRAAIGRRSTARLHGMDGAWGDHVEVILGRRTRQPAHWVTVIHSELEAPDRTTHKGIPTVTATRALLDLGAVIDDDDLELALESALRLGLTRCEYLEKRLAITGGRGRRGIAALRRVLAARGGNAKATESSLETRLVQMLRAHRIYPPERQYTIRDGTREVARVDLAWPSLQLAVEADGYRWHAGRVAWKRDLARLSDIASVGWRALHATKADIDDPYAFLPIVRRALGETTFPAFFSR